MAMCMPRELKPHLEKWLRTFKYKYIIWHTSVVLHFAIPNVACSYFPPSPGNPLGRMAAWAAHRVFC